LPTLGAKIHERPLHARPVNALHQPRPRHDGPASSVLLPPRGVAVHARTQCLDAVVLQITQPTKEAHKKTPWFQHVVEDTRDVQGADASDPWHRQRTDYLDLVVLPALTDMGR